MTDDEEASVGSYFVSTYPPFSTWTRDEIDAAQAVLQRPYDSRTGPSLGLYVHIPFCMERCRFCYYLSYADKSAKQMGDYVEAVLAEATRLAELPYLVDRQPAFVYFGGGTPSLLSEPRLEQLFCGLQRISPWQQTAEVSFECAPRTTTKAKLRLLRDLGVTRISIGVQAFRDDILKLNGRIHDVRHIDRALSAIREIGFEVFNLDLIVGLLGETDDSFLRGVARAIEYAPDMITIYQLEIPLNTPLYRDLRDGKTSEPPISWEQKRTRLDRGFSLLEQAGYDIRSAYAAVRDSVRHGFVYQDEQYRGADLLGLGAASFSYLGGVHYQNRPTHDAYLADAGAGRSAVERAHQLSDRERFIREFVLQLKLGRVDARYFRDKFRLDINEQFRETLASMEAKGWLTREDAGIALTREGLLRVDRLLREFYLPQHRDVRYS